MAVTAAGTPYVESSDLVANYPGDSLALANRVDQVMQAPTQNAQTGTAYTAVLLDAGKTVTRSNAAASTHTIPAQATIAWAANTQLNFLNIGAGIVTITPAATVTINGTPLTLATSKGGSLVRTASNVWTFIPFLGGPSSPVVNEGGSTGVTFSTLTNPDGDGINYRLAVWNASGTLVVTAPGLAQLLVVAGGGGGGSFTGGGGGCVRWGSFVIPAATQTVTIGAGGAANTPGGNSILGSVLRSGGGAPGESIADRFSGVGGGGSPGGYNKLTTDLHAGGGQGGTVYGGADQPTGILNLITGSSIEYGAGGRGTGGAGTANRGRGGATGSFIGGSGVVIARWEI